MPAFCWTSSNLMWAWRMAFFRIPCHRELIEGDRVHAHDQSLDRGVSADAFGELCWLPDQLPDSLRSGARLRMCTIHDGEPELARLPRLRKSQIKGILGPPGQSGTGERGSASSRTRGSYDLGDDAPTGLTKASGTPRRMSSESTHLWAAPPSDAWATVPDVPKERAPGHPGLFSSSVSLRRSHSPSRSVGAAVTAAEERPEPIVETNFEHLNLAARRESVSPERPRSKREVIQFEKVIFKLRRPISP